MSFERNEREEMTKKEVNVENKECNNTESYLRSNANSSNVSPAQVSVSPTQNSLLQSSVESTKLHKVNDNNAVGSSQNSENTNSNDSARINTMENRSSANNNHVWTDVQLLRYALKHSFQATDASEMVDASQSFALIYKVLAQKCAVVEDLVQSAIFNIEKNDKVNTESNTKPTTAVHVNSNESVITNTITNDNRNIKDNKEEDVSLKDKESHTMETTQSENDKIKNIADNTSNSTHINSSFHSEACSKSNEQTHNVNSKNTVTGIDPLSMMLLPPGLDDEDYAQERLGQSVPSLSLNKSSLETTMLQTSEHNAQSNPITANESSRALSHYTSAQMHANDVKPYFWLIATLRKVNLDALPLSTLEEQCKLPLEQLIRNFNEYVQCTTRASRLSEHNNEPIVSNIYTYAANKTSDVNHNADTDTNTTELPHNLHFEHNNTHNNNNYNDVDDGTESTKIDVNEGGSPYTCDPLTAGSPLRPRAVIDSFMPSLKTTIKTTITPFSSSSSELTQLSRNERKPMRSSEAMSTLPRAESTPNIRKGQWRISNDEFNENNHHGGNNDNKNYKLESTRVKAPRFSLTLMFATLLWNVSCTLWQAGFIEDAYEWLLLSDTKRLSLLIENIIQEEYKEELQEALHFNRGSAAVGKDNHLYSNQDEEHHNTTNNHDDECNISNETSSPNTPHVSLESSPLSLSSPPSPHPTATWSISQETLNHEYLYKLQWRSLFSSYSNNSEMKMRKTTTNLPIRHSPTITVPFNTASTNHPSSSSSLIASPLKETIPLKYQARYSPTRKASTYCQRLFHDITSLRDLCALVIHCHTAEDVVCLMTALSTALTDYEQKRTELATSQINKARSMIYEKNDNININIVEKENNNNVFDIAEEAIQTATEENNNNNTANMNDGSKKETVQHVSNDTEEEDCVAEMILFLNITVEFFLSKRTHKLYEEHMAQREREMKLLEHSDTFTRQFNSVVYKEEEENNHASHFATEISSRNNINKGNSNVKNTNNKNSEKGNEIIDNTLTSQKQLASSSHSDNNNNVSFDKNEKHDSNANDKKYYHEYMNKMMRLACNELVCECTNGAFSTVAELDEHGLPSVEEAPELLAPGIFYVLCINVLGSVLNFVNLYSVSRIYRSVALTETYHVNRTSSVYHDTSTKRTQSQNRSTSKSRSKSVNTSTEAVTNSTTKEINQNIKNTAVSAEKAHHQNSEANVIEPTAPHISFGDRLISFFTGVTNQSNTSSQSKTQPAHRQQFTSPMPLEPSLTLESEHKPFSSSTITSDNHISTTNTTSTSTTTSNNSKPSKVIGKSTMQHESPRSSSCSQSELQHQHQHEQMKQLDTLQLTEGRTHHPFILTHTGRELLLPSMHEKNGLLLLMEENITPEPHRYTRSRETRTLSELDTQPVQHNIIKNTNRERQKVDFTSHHSTTMAAGNDNTNSIVSKNEKKYNSYTKQSGNVNQETESKEETQELSLRLLTLFYRYRHIHRVEYIDTNVLCTVIQELNKAIYILRNKLRIHLGESWWTGWKHSHDVQMTNFYTKLVNEVSHIKRMYKSTLSDAGQPSSTNVAEPEHTPRNMTQRLYTKNSKQSETDHEAITCTRTHSTSSTAMTQTAKEQSMSDSNSSECNSSKRVCHVHNATLLPPSMPDPYVSSFPANKNYNDNTVNEDNNNNYNDSKISVVREKELSLLSQPNDYTSTHGVTATHGNGDESRHITHINNTSNNDTNNTSESDSSLLQCSVMTDQEVHKDKVVTRGKNSSNMIEQKNYKEEKYKKNSLKREEIAHKEEQHNTIESEKPLSSWWKQKVSVPSAAQLYKRREEGEKSNLSNKVASEDNQTNKTSEEVSTHNTTANNYKRSNSISKSGNNSNNNNNISVVSTTDKDQDKGAQRGESKLISTLHSAMTSVQMIHRKSINNEGKDENLLKQRQGSSMVEPSIVWDVPPRFIPSITIDFSAFTTSSLETQLATQQMVHEMIERQAQEQARLKIANMESGMINEGDHNSNNNKNNNKGKSNHSQVELVNDNTTGISILSAYSRQLLHDELPILQQYANWRIIYSSYVHGVSLNTLFTNCEREEADYQERHRYTSKRMMNWHEQQEQQHGGKNRKDCNELPSRPMLLVMELVPSTTYSFAADGQGVHDAKKVLVEELQKQKNLEKEEHLQQEHNLSKTKNMKEVQMQEMEHRARDTEKDNYEYENGRSSNILRSEDKYISDVNLFKDEHYSNVNTNIDETNKINSNTNDTREHVNENKAKVNKMIIGAYLSHLLHRNTRRYYGSGETFVFQIFQSARHGESNSNTLPQLHTFHSSGANQQFINCRRNSIVIGGGGSGSSIYIDDTLYRGATAPCATFTCSPPLTEWQPDADNSNNNSNMIDNSHNKYCQTNKLFNVTEENVSISGKDALNVNNESQFSLNDSNNVSNSSSGISTSFDILHL